VWGSVKINVKAYSLAIEGPCDIPDTAVMTPMKQNLGGRRFKDGGVEALRETVGGGAGHGLISCSVINAAVVVVVVWGGGDTVRVCLNCYY